jgi:flagellar basal body-associated protein FliL
MIRLVASCVWICLVTAGTGYAAATWKLSHAEAGAPDHPAEKLQYQKMNPINVPMIADGAVEGYVVAQLGYTYTDNAPRNTVPPEVYLDDEAFRIIYSDPRLDFHHLEKYDVGALTAALVQRVNQRLNANVIKDVLVQELNFVPKSDISK